MKETVNQQIVKEIERVADELQIDKREAAEALQRNFLNDGLLASAAQIDQYLRVTPA
jgi:hypothetical protein